MSRGLMYPKLYPRVILSASYIQADKAVSPQERPTETTGVSRGHFQGLGPLKGNSMGGRVFHKAAPLEPIAPKKFPGDHLPCVPVVSGSGFRCLVTFCVFTDLEVCELPA